MATIDDKGRIYIPAETLRVTHMAPGDEVDVYPGGPGAVLVASKVPRCAICGVKSGLTAFGTDPEWHLCGVHVLEAIDGTSEGKAARVE